MDLTTKVTACPVCALRRCAECGCRGAAGCGAGSGAAGLRRYVPPVVADSVLYDQARLRGERREISVLFADVVNFTQLSVSLDAEAVFNLINDLLRPVGRVHPSL